MGRRTLLLIAALLVAVLGTVAVFFYANNAKTQADGQQALVTVLVAKTDIALGTKGSAAAANGAFESKQVRQADVVAGALSDVTPIADLVALVPVFTGQQIISNQWGVVAATGGLALPPGKVAISVQLGDPQRVAGFISPGAEVVIFVQGSTVVVGKPNSASVRTLLARVPVIAVGPSTVVSKTTQTGAGANTEQIPTAILTLAVTQLEAEKIIFASGSTPSAPYNSLWFGLMDKNSKVLPNDPGINPDNLFK